MEKDQRLTPLPNIGVDLQTVNQDYPANYAPVYDDDNFEEKRSLRQYFAIVYKRLPLILALCILTTAAAAFYMYRQPSIYQASTEMIIEPRKPRGGQSKDSININFGNDANYNNTQLQLLQNPELMKNVVVQLGLQRQPNLFNNQSKGIVETLQSVFSRGKSSENTNSSLPVITETANTDENSPEAALTTEEKARAENYAGTLLGGLKIDQVPSTNLVNIILVSTNPELSAKVSDKLAETYIDENAKRETQGAKKTYEELTKSIEDLKSTISGQEAELIAATARDGAPPLGEKSNDVSASIVQNLSVSWLAARDKRADIEVRYTTAQKNIAAGKGDQDLADNPIYQNTIKSIGERRAKLQDVLRDYDGRINNASIELSQLRVKYTDDNPKVQDKLTQIQSLKDTKEKTEKANTELIDRDEKKIKNEGQGGALISLKSQLDAARTREDQALSLYLAEADKAHRQGIEETKLTTLRHELETNRSLLDKYTQSQKEQELLIAGSSPDNLKISNHALVPTAPIGPQRARNIFIAFLISLAAGIGLAFLMDYLDDSVRTSDDIGRHLGLPTLALIPHQNLLEKRKNTELALSKNSNGNNTSMALIALQDQRSPMAEAYRHLRTSLLFSSAGKPPQTILVTSSQPSEGKTTTAINTAITLAQSDADVVIIDCDLRRPRLHHHFSMTNSHGLTNYLSGEKNPENLLKPYPSLPKLKVITSGPIPPNPAELLSSNEMKNLLQFLKGKYKHIVIDSPPAISFTDAAILSTQVDGVVLVAMAGKSSLHLMRRFKQRLSSIGARIYGVVLNGIKANSVEYDYYSTAYSYYDSPEDDSTPLMKDVQSIHTTSEEV